MRSRREAILFFKWLLKERVKSYPISSDETDSVTDYYTHAIADMEKAQREEDDA